MGEIIGSNVLMSIEMGIPYTYLSGFLLNDDKLLSPYVDDVKDSYNLFGDDRTTPHITKEQIAFVNYWGGIEHSISRSQCAKILYWYFLRTLFSTLFSKKGLMFMLLRKLWRKPHFFLAKGFLRSLKEMYRL